MQGSEIIQKHSDECRLELAIELSSLQVFECVELFAGTAWVSKSMKYHGHPTASFDIKMAEKTREPVKEIMDMESLSGFATPGFYSIVFESMCKFLRTQIVKPAFVLAA